MKTAILGAGTIARSMAAAINGLDDSVEAYAVASRNPDRAEQFQKTWGFQKMYGSYEEMLEDPEVDLVYVATPHSHHFEHARMCIEHGKAVLVEKSFTANAEQARELIRLAEEKGVLLTEAIWTRYMPSRKILDELLASGIIGDVRMVTADLCYPIEAKGRITDPALAGGALLDLGVYPLNFAAMTLGSDIKEISGGCTFCDTGVDSQENMTLTYEDGRIANLSASVMTASHRYGILHGSKGYIHCTNINNIEKIEIFDQDHRLVREVPIPKQINGYEYEVLACQKALEEGRIECPEMPHSETIRIMEWMDKLRRDWGIRYPFE